MHIFLQYIESRIKFTQLTVKYTAPRWLMPEMSGIIPVHEEPCVHSNKKCVKYNITIIKVFNSHYAE